MTVAELVPTRLEVAKGGQYASDRNADGTWNVRDVPIFVAHGEHYTREWCEAAVFTAQLRHTSGHDAPLHVYHHEFSGDPIEAATVKECGVFVPTRVGEIEYEGKPTPAVFADLLAVPQDVYEQVKAKRLRYRSVEILDKRQTEIDSCALLNHEVPRFKLPMLTIGRETFSSDRSQSAVFIFRAQEEGVMPDPNDKAAANAQPQGQAPQPGQQPAQPAAPTPAAIDVNAMAKAIGAAVATEIKNELSDIKTAITTKPGREEGDPDAHEGEDPVEQKKGSDKKELAGVFRAQREHAERMKALEDENAKFRAERARNDAERAAEGAVRKAVFRLQKLDVKIDEAYEAELRTKASKSLELLEEHVATREKFGARDPKPWDGVGPRRGNGRRPEIQKYAAAGADVLEKAERFAAQWDGMPDGIRAGLSLADHLKAQLEPPASVVRLNGKGN